MFSEREVFQVPDPALCREVSLSFVPLGHLAQPCSSKDFEICLSRGQEFADIDEKNMEFEKMWMTPRPVRGRAWSTSDQAGDTCSNLEFCWMDHRAHLATVVPVVGSFLMLSSCLMVRFSQSSLQINTLWLVQH